MVETTVVDGFQVVPVPARRKSYRTKYDKIRAALLKLEPGVGIPLDVPEGDHITAFANRVAQALRNDRKTGFPVSVHQDPNNNRIVVSRRAE